MKYVVKIGDRYGGVVDCSYSSQKFAHVYDSKEKAMEFAGEYGGRLVRLVPRKPKPPEPERTLGQVAHDAMWPFAPPMLPHELRAPDWECVAAAVVAEHERRKAGAK